jgi:tetratricopeptide (TPR) repeat protein
MIAMSRNLGWRCCAAVAILLMVGLQACAPVKRTASTCAATTADDLYNCGNRKYGEGAYTDAIAAYDAVIALEPNSVDALYQRGRSYRYTGQLEAALQDFTDVIRLQPNHIGALINRSDTYVSMGNREAAQEDNAAVLRIDPTVADAYYNQACDYYRLENFEDAAAAFSQAVLFYGEAANGPTERVKGWYTMGHFAQRIAPGSSLRIVDRDLADAYYWRARAYRHLGDAGRADEDLAQAVRIDPGVVARAGQSP